MNKYCVFIVIVIFVVYPLGLGSRPCPQGFVEHILGITEQTDLSAQLFSVLPFAAAEGKQALSNLKLSCRFCKNHFSWIP